jgi:hypothetical protein
MGTRSTNVRRNNRHKENWATEDPTGRHVQGTGRRTMVTNSQKPARMEYIYTTSVKETSLEIAHLVMVQFCSPCFHQQAVALLRLIRLIYLFIIYLFIYFTYLFISTINPKHLGRKGETDI